MDRKSLSERKKNVGKVIIIVWAIKGLPQEYIESWGKRNPRKP